MKSPSNPQFDQPKPNHANCCVVTNAAIIANTTDLVDLFDFFDALHDFFGVLAVRARANVVTGIVRGVGNPRSRMRSLCISNTNIQVAHVIKFRIHRGGPQFPGLLQIGGQVKSL